MSSLSWYWHRLRAMGPGEIARHVQKKLLQSADANRRAWPKVDLTCPGVYPTLPKPGEAPDALRVALRRDADDILAGRWRFFGHLELKVDDPPKWQCDYLAGKDLETSVSAFQLNYRTLPDRVDSKLIWEPSRWQQLVRLAMAAYVLGDRRAATKCMDWLEDWVHHNPPYRGWNWTSALEVGLRLIQFTWIDALLLDLRFTKEDLRTGGDRKTAGDRGSHTDQNSPFKERLAKLRQDILPPHVWYAWRHRSFGSSANNHLLGELTGCIVATARWPGLARCGASLTELQRQWEQEVLVQFNEDGGNREQALNYHLFSWEFCCQAGLALAAAGRPASSAVEQRLQLAARFFVEVQVPEDPWDYGDSDHACVTPFFTSDLTAVTEWHHWFRDPSASPTLAYWLGTARSPRANAADSGASGWRYFPASGQALRSLDGWKLRWDLSPLGLGSMAAHGHLDALHLSLWITETAMIIDPGTGAYHADQKLRTWLASREAHNGPAPESEEWPKRLGPFLWEETHEALELESGTVSGAKAELVTPALSVGRSIEIGLDRRTVTVSDWVESRRDDWADAGRGFSVCWQFAPETRIESLAPRRFRVSRHGASLEIEVNDGWSEVLCEPKPSPPTAATPPASMPGTVSPSFRRVVQAPYLKLLARPSSTQPGVYTTTFRRS